MASKLSYKQAKQLVENKVITQEVMDNMIKEGVVSQGIQSNDVWTIEDANGIEVMPKFSFQAVVSQDKSFRTAQTGEIKKFLDGLDKLYEKYFTKKDSAYVKEQRGETETASTETSKTGF